jgi:restriction system protein
MGSIIMSAKGVRASLSEDAGTRSGFALSDPDLDELLGTNHELVGADPAEAYRIKASVYEETVGDILHKLGAADVPGMPTLARRIIQELDFDWRSRISLDQLLDMEGLAHELCRRRAAREGNGDEIVREIRELLGSAFDAFEPALDAAMAVHLAHCPFLSISLAGPEAVKLVDLFQSEEAPRTGEFFDQRFINYLDRNPDKLGEIHWRQFEQMTAEWLDREGYKVELGPGRNDEGVDVRAWREDALPGTPPALLVQCKREKGKVGRTVVKALWADIHHEKAEAGLVVTTNDISPGAKRDIKARSYPITPVNRKNVRSWLSAMRKPQAGILFDA